MTLRPARFTRDELLEAQRHALWLAQEVRAFQDRVDGFAEDFGLSVAEGWAVRFPMLEPELVEYISRARLPHHGNLNGVADRMVARRTGTPEKYMREIRHGTEPRARRRKKASPPQPVDARSANDRQPRADSKAKKNQKARASEWRRLLDVPLKRDGD